MFVPDYFNRVNPDLLALIPPDAKTVLEIGCGAGALAEAFTRINPAIEWHGFDINPEVGEMAASRMASFDWGDIEDGNGYAYFDVDHEDWYDVLILGDVLEHLKDPWAQLKRLSAYVKPTAQILACIPNVQHWTVIRDLLRGKWTYTDEGLLDRTHLRFFTLDSIREMFDQAGLQIFEIRGRDICNEGFEAFLDEWFEPMSVSKAPKEWRAYQYIVRAIKPAMAWHPIASGSSGSCTIKIEASNGKPERVQSLHIHAVLAEACCARPRILEPFKMFETVPGVTCGTSEWPFNPNKIPDVLIQQRHRQLNLTKQQFLCGQSLVIAELDDDPDGLEGYKERDYVQLRAVHAVQVSTERLAETVRQWNPNVMVFENQIAELPKWEDRNPSDRIRLFYGAQNRQDDWKPIMPALNRVLADHPEVQFMVIHDREFYDALEWCDKRFQAFCEYAKYRQLLQSCHIALLPLEPTRFNEHKSDLKFLECAAEGVVPIMSLTALGALPDDIDDLYSSPTICAYVSPEGFEDELRHVIDNAVYRREYAEANYAYVRDHRLLSQHFRKRLAWYQELLSSKPTLDRQLWERVPELAPRDLSMTSA